MTARRGSAGRPSTYLSCEGWQSPKTTLPLNWAQNSFSKRLAQAVSFGYSAR
jgi:hypothetical protein